MSDCLNSEKHTPWPKGFLARYYWAKSMRKTHKQERCPVCGLWVIWTLKDKP